MRIFFALYWTDDLHEPFGFHSLFDFEEDALAYIEDFTGNNIYYKIEKVYIKR